MLATLLQHASGKAIFSTLEQLVPHAFSKPTEVVVVALSKH